MSGIVDALIVVPCLCGLAWSAKECLYLKNVKMDGHPGVLTKSDSLGEDNAKIVSIMKEIAGYISDGAQSFLWKEYQ